MNQGIIQRVSAGLLCLLCTACVSTMSSRDMGQVGQSRQGIAVAAQPEASHAAKLILEAGGNAADAAVAAGFAIAVVEPTMNSIGGRNQILVRTGAGSFQAYNGMTEIPANYVRPENPVANGYGVIATPGVVAALWRLHQEHGSLPWAEVVQPAIDLAEDGYEMLPGAAARHARTLDAIKSNPGFQKNFLKVDGSTYQAGEILKQPVLARTLGEIAKQGADAFYAGDIAEAIAEDMAANEGFVTLDDLQNYKALDGRYITTKYRDVEVHSIAAPAGGGLVVKTLNILENIDMGSLTDLQWGAVVNQALALAIRSMAVDYQELDLAQVTNKSWAKAQAALITVPDIGVETSALTAIGQPHLLAANTDWTGDSWGKDSHHTTHFVTADCEGMTVSITQTLGPAFGSKVVTPDLGFVYASTMGTYLSTAEQKPGTRPRTTIAPTIVTRNGEVELVLGAAGGLRILSAIVQTISRYVDQEMTLPEAVAAPRVHPETSTDSKTGKRNVELLAFHAEQTDENGWSESDIEAWQAAGLTIKPNQRYGAFGRIHALKSTSEGWLGAADLDWEGSVATPSRSSCSNQR